MLLPKSKLETVELMNKEYYLGDLSYDLVKDEYSFKRNEDIKDLSLYPGEFYGLFTRKEREVPSDVIRDFIVDRIIPYNRMIVILSIIISNILMNGKCLLLLRECAF